MRTPPSQTATISRVAEDVPGRVSGNEQKAGAGALRETAAVRHGEALGRSRGRRYQRFQRRQTGIDQKFQLAVETHPVSGTRIGCVGAGKDRHIGSFQEADCFDGVRGAHG